MAETESYAERTQQKSPPNLITPELAAMGKKRIEDLAKVQTELFDKLQETNRQWLDRMQAETNLATEFTTKMLAARSMPEAMSACQEWANRRVEMMTEDGKHLLADVQKVAETSTRLLSSGWLSNGKGGGGLST